MKRTIALLALICLLVASFASCEGNSGIGDIIDSIPEVSDTVSEVSQGEESEVEPKTEAGYTDRPFVTQVINITASRICVAGTCVPGATVYVRGISIEAETTSQTGYFIMELELPSSGTALLECTAVANGLKESTVRYFNAQYKATVSERKDGHAVTIGKQGQLFLNSTLPDYYGETLLTITQLSDIKKLVNDTYDSIQATRRKYARDAYQNERAVALGRVLNEEEIAECIEYADAHIFKEVPYLFVLVPSALSMYSDLAPDSVETTTNSTRYSQIVKALKETKATVVDMKEVFSSHMNDQYPIYGTTDSYWTDYGAYLAYKEIMDIISVDYPAAAARPLSDFTIEETEILGGDMVGYLYLNREDIKEKAVIMTPKFTIPFESNIYVGEDDRTLSYETNEDKLASFAARRPLNVAQNKVGGDGKYIKTYPNALVLRDEWSAQMYDILAERFNGVIYSKAYVTGGAYNEATETPFTTRIVDINYIRPEMQPDYVIVIVSEENLSVCFGLE